MHEAQLILHGRWDELRLVHDASNLLLKQAVWVVPLRPVALSGLFAVLLVSVTSIALLFELAPFAVFSVGWS